MKGGKLKTCNDCSTVETRERSVKCVPNTLHGRIAQSNFKCIVKRITMLNIADKVKVNSIYGSCWDKISIEQFNELAGISADVENFSGKGKEKDGIKELTRKSILKKKCPDCGETDHQNGECIL